MMMRIIANIIRLLINIIYMRDVIGVMLHHQCQARHSFRKCILRGIYKLYYNSFNRVHIWNRMHVGHQITLPIYHFFKINSLPLNYNGMFMKMFIYFIFNTCISIQISSTLEDLYNLIMATTSKTS